MLHILSASLSLQDKGTLLAWVQWAGTGPWKSTRHSGFLALSCQCWTTVGWPTQTGPHLGLTCKQTSSTLRITGKQTSPQTRPLCGSQIEAAHRFRMRPLWNIIF